MIPILLMLAVLDLLVGELFAPGVHPVLLLVAFPLSMLGFRRGWHLAVAAVQGYGRGTRPSWEHVYCAILFATSQILVFALVLYRHLSPNDLSVLVAGAAPATLPRYSA